MQIDIIELSKVIGAIVAIASFLIGVYKVIKGLEKLKEHINENTIYVLKLVILNNELSIEERIHAGDRYIALGGNGYVKHIYQSLLEEIDKKGGV